MSEQDQQLMITEQIDADEALQGKRKLLVLTSLVLLALSFSGATIKEANTLILKLEFTQQKGISVLLVLAVFFLMLRYYNYARKYHDQLTKLWVNRLLKEHELFYVCPYSDDTSGVVTDLMPRGFDLQELSYHDYHWDFDYKPLLAFRRAIHFSWQDQNQDFEEISPFFSRVKPKDYFKILRLELKHQFWSYVTHRENLDILAPYIIGLLAILSFCFNAQLQQLLKLLVTP